MQRLMNNYIQEAGLSHATIKALRYSFATHPPAQSLKAQYMQANRL